MKNFFKKFIIYVTVISVLLGMSYLGDNHISAEEPFTLNYFDGKGTQDSPYLIQSLNDLQVFRDMVNSGYTFKGKYVRQSIDIYMSKRVDWTPIGIYDSNNYFYGIYDGDGHTISNLCVDTSYAGFFGMLCGKVVNLGIQSGELKGSYVGSLASHGSNQACIINCYSEADLYGEQRVGGIVDNMSDGAIISCWFDGTLRLAENGESCVSICSYTAAELIDSYSLNNVYNSVSDYYAGNIDVAMDTNDLQGCMEKMNTGLCKADKVLSEISYIKYAIVGQELIHKTIDYKSQEMKLEGDGSEKSPYLIQSVDDLIQFQEAVNSGRRFEDTYFLQTCDLNLEEISQWNVIGNPKNYTMFCGIYNGQGHVISNINCSSDSEAALFGVLKGSVANLGIDSGNFYGGKYASSFAVYLLSGGYLINCYNRADVSGIKTAGISTFNNGAIVCCWNAGTQYADACFEIAYDGNGTVAYCLRETDAFVGEDYSGKLENNVRFGDTTVKELNKLVKLVENEKLVNCSLNKWIAKDKNIVYSKKTVNKFDVFMVRIYNSLFKIVVIFAFLVFLGFTIYAFVPRRGK